VVRAEHNANSFVPEARTVDSRSYLERTVALIATLSRDELKTRLKDFQDSRKLDFTEDYLDTISLDRLRHILLAVVLTCKSNG
jgi:hypothetical protein